MKTVEKDPREERATLVNTAAIDRRPPLKWSWGAHRHWSSSLYRSERITRAPYRPLTQAVCLFPFCFLTMTVSRPERYAALRQQSSKTGGRNERHNPRHHEPETERRPACKTRNRVRLADWRIALHMSTGVSSAVACTIRTHQFLLSDALKKGADTVVRSLVHCVLRGRRGGRDHVAADEQK